MSTLVEIPKRLPQKNRNALSCPPPPLGISSGVERFACERHLTDLEILRLCQAHVLRAKTWSTWSTWSNPTRPGTSDSCMGEDVEGPCPKLHCSEPGSFDVFTNGGS